MTYHPKGTRKYNEENFFVFITVMIIKNDINTEPIQERFKYLVINIQVGKHIGKSKDKIITERRHLQHRVNVLKK